MSETNAEPKPAIAPAGAITAAPPRRDGLAHLAFVPRNLDDAWRVADLLSKAGILPDALRGKPHDILVTVMTGSELGLSPMQSIRDIYVVKGRGYVSSLLKVALVKQSPECEWFRCVESTDKVATFVTRRRGEGETRFSFTIDEARAADLTGRQKKPGDGKDNWEKYPALMLRRRCSGQLADEVYPDVVRGIGDSDDVVQAEPGSLNRVPNTYAPPPPEIEEAQLAPPSPPKAERKLNFEEAPPPAASPKPEAQREPGDDDDVPLPPPPKAEPPNDLAVLAMVRAIDVTKPGAAKELDDLSPIARAIQGPARGDISSEFIAKRKALAALKAGK